MHRLPTLRLALVALLAVALPAGAAIRRDPTGVNVASQGATSVLISFGGLNRQIPIEAFWCGALVSAAPDLGFKCDPRSIFGRLPLRFNQSQLAAGGTAFTDVMTIPAAVSRRAYQAAARGEEPSFFYVRRFQSTVGGPDEFVFVTCRLSAGGARTPLALLDVDLRFEGDETVAAVARDGAPPRFAATLRYNGSGTLRGRWEVVQPGDLPPSSRDLLTEGTLPAEERLLLQRYTVLGRFSLPLPPTGEVLLPGPDPGALPTATEGLYLVLLRIEAGDDRESDSNLANAGVGQGILRGAGVAGFPLPTLRYVVGSGTAKITNFVLLSPVDGRALAAEAPLDLAWPTVRDALLYRIEIAAADGQELFSAIVQQGIGQYRAPSWLAERAAGAAVKARVVALGPEEIEVATTTWREVRWQASGASSKPPGS